jgi:ZIP family zinc transporter
MDQLVIIAVLSWCAGLAAFLGSLAARFEHIPESTGKREIIHGIVAFGGGVLVAGVAFALAPEGIANLSAPSLGLLASAGGIAFCLLDARLSHQGGTKAQFMAMLMDFVPEAIALGGVFAHNHKLGFLLALFIGSQNLPEGFNAYRELIGSGAKPRTAMLSIFSASFLGPIAALAGFLVLQDCPSVTSGIMVFASGGILYLIFQDIAPKAHMRWHWTPPLGAVLGFIVGMIGKKLLW